MQVCWTIEAMFPNAQSNYEVVVSPDGSEWKITKWNLDVPKPTIDEIETYWSEHESEITSAHQPLKSEFEILKETVDQLVLDNLMGGF